MLEFNKLLIFLILISMLLSFCGDDKIDNSTPKLHFVNEFNGTQARLDNFGQVSVIPVGHAAQTPVFHGLAVNYIEFATDSLTLLGLGDIVYQSTQTSAGGAMAIKFSDLIVADEGDTFLSIPITDLSPGSYTWIRVSLAYQNYDIAFKALGFNLTGRVASFVGYNNYIESYQIKDSTITVNANRLQGYGAIETPYQVVSWQAPPGATTVPNPIAATSPIPAGSCVVTGRFSNPLIITGNETEDLKIVLSVSINQSFEWVDSISNNIFEPLDGEKVVDMGLRGLIPRVE